MIYRYVTFGSYGQWVGAFIVASASFVSGTFLGWPASALPQIRDGSAGFILTDDEQSWMVTLGSIGSFFSPIPCGYLMDRIGRKYTLLLFDGLMLVSWIMLTYSTTVVPIYIARILCGLWGGVEYTTVLLYICEISEPRLRGTLGTIGELMLFSGAFFESVLAHLPYKIIAACSAIPAIWLFVGLLLIPESPYFYLMRGNREAATESVKWFRGSCKAEDMDKMETAVKEQLANTGSFAEIFTSSVNFKALLIVQCLKIVLGSSSIILLLAYTSVILPDSWVSARNGFTVLCAVWIVSGVFACTIMDKINRRTFLFVSSFGTLISLAFTSMWYYLRYKTSIDTSTTTWVPLVTLIIAGSFETAGIFNVPNVVKGEIFAINIKSKASAISCMTAFLFEGITTFFYYPITRNIGLYFNFVKIMITSALCIVIVKFALIETRGKSLEEIQLVLNNDCGDDDLVWTTNVLETRPIKSTG
uniref:Facilitated trehalose transporter Tret1 n=1 Tax=Lygus hesperus TaxID=30085 RepID=A0A0A9WLD8_LYGHE